MRRINDSIGAFQNYYLTHKSIQERIRRVICIFLFFLILHSCVPVQAFAVDDGIHSKTDYHVDDYYQYAYQSYQISVGSEAYFWQQYLANDDRWVFVQIAEMMRSDQGFQFVLDLGERLLSLDSSDIYHYFMLEDPRQEDIVDYYVTALSSLMMTMDTNMDDIRNEQANADATMDWKDYLAEGEQLAYSAAALFIEYPVITEAFSIGGISVDIIADSLESFEQAALLAKNAENFVLYYNLLKLTIDYTVDKNLIEAASSLQTATGKCFEYYTQHLVSDYSDTATNALSDSFLDVVDKVAEHADGSFSPDEIKALGSLSQATKYFNTIKLGADYIKFVYDIVLNYSDNILRDYEILALAEVRRALIAEINRLNAQIKSPEDYMAIKDACGLLEDLLYVSLRGEYCAYMLYTREQKYSSEYTEDWFNGFSYKLSRLKSILEHHIFVDWEKFAIENADLPVAHPYKVIENGISSWKEAEQYCESIGGHLATISSEEENSYVYQLMLNSGYTSAYFGLTDSSSEGTWRWVTGEPLTYLNWATQEPNSENSNDDYAMFYYKYTDGTWNDGDFGGKTVSCGTAFICEWDDTQNNYPQNNQPTIVIEPQTSPNDILVPKSGLLASGICGEAGNNLTWTFYEDGTLVIEGSGKMADYLFQEGYPDQTAPWLMVSLSTQTEIERVEIANGVTSIGDCAFATYYCDKLTTVVIPDTVTHIGKHAFAFLTGLRSLNLPASITYIGDYAFGETGITDVYYAGSEAEWDAIRKSTQKETWIFNTYEPPTIHFQGSSSAQYRENYRTVIENMIESSAAEKDKWNRTAYGMLVDLDDDGIDELVIVYRRDLSNVHTVLCDVYDIENGQVKTVLEKQEVNTEVAGNSGEITIVSYNGKTYLALSTGGGWALGMYTQESTRLIDCLTGQETVFLHKWFQSENTREDNTYSIGGISCSAADYEAALGQIQALASLDISGGQNTLDELLKTLSSRTGKSAGDWQRPYTDYLSKLRSRSDAKYIAIYMPNVDADDVPELLVELPTNAEGARLCYADGNSVQEQSVYSYSFSYIPGSGLFRENGGHMDEYYDSIYRLENGSVQMIAHGEYGAEDNANVQRDAAGAPIYNYFWNGSRVDQASYYNMLNALFDTSREVSPYGGQSMSVEQALNELGTKQLVASAVSSAGKPGPDDLKGQDGVASPTSGWLAEYQIKYVKGTTSGNAYLRWSPSNDGREYKRYVKEGEKVTVLASENGYSLVLASDGRAGWVTSKLLA